MKGTIDVNGARLGHRITGEGEPVLQIHGAGFGRFNFDRATPSSRNTSASSTSTWAATGSRNAGSTSAARRATREPPNAEKHMTASSSHSTIFDGTAEHNRVVIDFFQRHGAT